MIGTSALKIDRAARIKDYVAIEEVADRFIGAGKKQGRLRAYSSPLRSDSDPSLKIDPARQTFVDYGNSSEEANGDVISLYMYVTGTRDFVTALDEIEDIFLPASRNGTFTKLRTIIKPKPTVNTRAKPSDEWQAFISHRIDQYHQTLFSTHADAQKALKYLTDVRGLSIETIKRYKLGFNPHFKYEPKLKIAIQAGITIPTVYSGDVYALNVKTIVGDFADYLGVPEAEYQNKTLAKYLQATHGMAIRPFGFDEMENAESVVICEGELDAILLSQHVGDRVAVITFGGTGSIRNIPDAWITKIKGFPHVVSVMDNDNAGRDAINRLYELFGDAHKPLQLPEGYSDISDYLLDGQSIDQLFIQKSALFPFGVPDSFRTALLSYFPKSIAPTIELLNHAINNGMIDPEFISLKKLAEVNEELGFGIAYTTLARGFKEHVIPCFLNEVSEGFIKSQEDLISKFPPNIDNIGGKK